MVSSTGGAATLLSSRIHLSKQAGFSGGGAPGRAALPRFSQRSTVCIASDDVKQKKRNKKSKGGGGGKKGANGGADLMTGIFAPSNVDLHREYMQSGPQGFLCSTGPFGNEEGEGKKEGKVRVEKKFSTLVLMRHGESMWNHHDLFTGDVDIPLTEKGVIEALAGGKVIENIPFDVIFSSRLCRANMTAMIAMTKNKSGKVPVRIRGGVKEKEGGDTGDANRRRLREAALKALYLADCDMVPLYADPRLNERCYGDLQGLNKKMAVEEFGEEQVSKWRRSYDTVPPKGESLLQTGQRTVEFFEEHTIPRLLDGQNVLIVAHGNVLRTMVTHICGLSMDDCLRMHLATAAPLVFNFNREHECFQQLGCDEPINPMTGEVIENKPRGLASVLKKASDDDVNR